MTDTATDRDEATHRREKPDYIFLWFWVLMARWVWLTIERGASLQSVLSSPERTCLMSLLFALMIVFMFRAVYRPRPATGWRI